VEIEVDHRCNHLGCLLFPVIGQGPAADLGNAVLVDAAVHGPLAGVEVLGCLPHVFTRGTRPSIEGFD
jgi:hypothetical protein